MINITCIKNATEHRQRKMSLDGQTGVLMHVIHRKLKRLKLLGISITICQRLEEAILERWPYSKLVEILLTDEIKFRDKRQLTMKLARSRLDQIW